MRASVFTTKKSFESAAWKISTHLKTILLKENMSEKETKIGLVGRFMLRKCLDRHKKYGLVGKYNGFDYQVNNTHLKN
jgi:hypothetical protein